MESAQHPEFDELAAFVDSRLSGDRRRRIVEHLASCPECRDLFADAARLVAEVDFGEAGRRRLLTGPWRRRAALAAALAASVALVLLSPRIVELFAKSPNTLAAVTADLVRGDEAPDRQLSTALSETWQGHHWPRPRGPGARPTLSGEERSFQLGVRVMELEIALRSGQGQLAQRMTYRLDSLLPEDVDSEQVRYLYTADEGIRGQLVAGADPRSLTPLNATGAELLRAGAATGGEDLTDRSSFELGVWARAAQLAAATGHGEFFAQRSNRRRLRVFAEEARDASVAASLERLVRLSEESTAQLVKFERELEILVSVAGGGEPPATAS